MTALMPVGIVHPYAVLYSKRNIEHVTIFTKIITL